jgi:hypothetical protein
MLIIRYIYFTVSTFKIIPSALVYISPRGLISILLFLQIKEVKFIDLSKTIIDERVLLVVILLSMMIMTLGTMKKTVDKDETDFLENTEEANTNSLDKFLDEIANEKDDLT